MRERGLAIGTAHVHGNGLNAGALTFRERQIAPRQTIGGLAILDDNYLPW